MQIVPYMPIHPAQLNSNNNNIPIIDEKEQKNQGEIKKENDDHLFKKPFLPVPYTVEEPSEYILKRPQRMKRFDYKNKFSYKNQSFFFIIGVIRNQ